MAERIRRVLTHLNPESNVQARETISPLDIASSIDHTNLKITATIDDLLKLCAEAKKYNFASVCVQPCHVSLCAEVLQHSEVAVCTVIGFPNGFSTTTTKVAETRNAVANGATEIDMVINICRAKDHHFKYIENEIRQVVEAAEGNCVKVIIETDQLTNKEVVQACMACVHAGSHYVKTSTGVNGKANFDVVKLMRAALPAEMKIKAAGGIRNVVDARKYIELGCSRLGMSAGVTVMKQAFGEEDIKDIKSTY